MRPEKFFSTAFVIVAIVLIAFTACSCVEAPSSAKPTLTPKAPLSGASSFPYEIDPIFREYYTHLGGIIVLGPAISPAFNEGITTVQFVESGKLVFDPSAPRVRKFGMAPLGRQMNIEEPPVPVPAQPEIIYINGHTIFPGFLPLYEKLGANTVGNPLTELRYNPQRRRFEQFFENLGFYQREDSDEIGLLAYGAWVCDDQCRNALGGMNARMDILQPADPAFKDYIASMGTDFTGFPLTESYIAGDGNKEQILENIVVATDPNQSVLLRPLSASLNIPVEPPQPASSNPNMAFYPTEGDKGYGIPQNFWNYIQQHGGIENFGPPITHYAPLFDNSYHQCFMKVCLAYSPNANEGAQIRPEPLGYAYKVLYYDSKPVNVVQPTAVPTAVTEAVEIMLQVWVRFPAIDSSQAQEIGVIVLMNDLPAESKILNLVLIAPDGSQVDYPFPPTDAKGITGLRIPPISGSNGTLIPYKVCMEMQSNTRFCVGDSFVIWNNP